MVRGLRTAAPAVFALAALAGIAITLATLLSTPAVDIGAWRSESHDALSIYLGQGLYHDPSSGGYTGLLYTPLLPALVALLYEISVWNGWPVLISIVASLTLAGLIAMLALRAAGDRLPATAVGAAGMGGLALWLATSTTGILYLGWTDDLMWALAFGGLIAGARAHLSRRAAALTVALLTAAFWTKQTAIAPIVVYALWQIVLAARGRRSGGFVVGLLAGLALTNLAVLAILQLASGGWELFFNLTLPQRQAEVYGGSQFASDLLHVIAVPALVAIALGASALWRTDRRLELDSTAALLCTFAVVGVPFAMWFRAKQGGATNQYFGVVWALGAVTALAWGACRAEGRRALAADAAIAVALLGAVVATAAGPDRYGLQQLHVSYRRSVPVALRALAHLGPLFDPLYTALVPGHVYPDINNVADLLAGDEQPRMLITALLQRRFRYAVTYEAALGPGGISEFDTYASAYGRYEANYLWKLDQVIEAGYRPTPQLPSGVLERRPGPNRAAALAGCFGPFLIAGRQWTIGAGGGLWCRSGPAAVLMRAAPASASQLITTAELVASGTLVLSATRVGAGVLMTGGGGWGLLARRTATGWTLRSRASGASRAASVRGALLSLNLGGGTGVPAMGDRTPARISLLATPGDGVTVQTSGLRLAG
jgi:hypothetical protein